MDRLVKPDVKELELNFQRGQKCSTTFDLTNLMHTMSVAVSLTTTNPSSSSAFSIDRPFSTIPPLSSSTYTLSLSNPFDDQPPPSAATCAVTVTVRTSILLAGKPNHDGDLGRIFSSEPRGPHVFTDAVIPVSLVGHHVAEYIISNRIPETRSLLNKAISRCVSHSQLSSLLTYAVERGKADSVAVLMDAGADANCKDENGKSLVASAIRAGNSVDVVKVLLASGCRIDNPVDFVLHEAAAANRVDLMELLLEFLDEGDDVNSVNHEGRTPIHVAARHGHVEVIRFCVSMGGDTNGVDLKGWTPLHCAASEGQLRAVECLLECCCHEAKGAVDKDGKTAFAVAMENGHLELGDLLHWGDVLFRAARVDDVHGMASCLAVGASVNGRDQNGWTPLHWAAFKGRVRSVEVLIQHGAEVDAVDDDGYTPLRCAVEAGHLQVALVLVARGSSASPNNKGFEGGFVAPRRLLDCFGKQLCRKYSFSRRDHAERKSNLEDVLLD